RGKVALGSIDRDRASLIALVETRRDCAPAPRATEVQPIEVLDLAVAPVTHWHGTEERGRFASAHALQKALEPGAPLAWFEHTTHTLGLDERRRQKILAARLPCLAIGILRIPLERSLAQQAAKRIVVARDRVVERQGSCERRIGMRSTAHGIRRL